MISNSIKYPHMSIKNSKLSKYAALKQNEYLWQELLEIYWYLYIYTTLFCVLEDHQKTLNRLIISATLIHQQFLGTPLFLRMLLDISSNTSIHNSRANSHHTCTLCKNKNMSKVDITWLKVWSKVICLKMIAYIGTNQSVPNTNQGGWNNTYAVPHSVHSQKTASY